jgi:predicted protein tyrosine phosphatase
MSARFEIRVGGLHSIGALVPEFRPTHLLGILDPPTPEPAIYDHDPDSRTTLLLRFQDIDASQPDGPTVEHAAKIIAFADQVRSAHAHRPARLLVHCHAGCDQSQVIAELRSAQLIASHGAARCCGSPAIPGRTAASSRSPTTPSALRVACWRPLMPTAKPISTGWNR